jgi:hypothetical protein
MASAFYFSLTTHYYFLPHSTVTLFAKFLG